MLYIIYITSQHNVLLSVANKTHKPLISLGLCVFSFDYSMHDLIHGRDTEVFQAYEFPVLVQKSV